MSFLFGSRLSYVHTANTCKSRKYICVGCTGIHPVSSVFFSGWLILNACILRALFEVQFHDQKLFMYSAQQINHEWKRSSWSDFYSHLKIYRWLYLDGYKYRINSSSFLWSISPFWGVRILFLCGQTFPRGVEYFMEMHGSIGAYFQTLFTPHFSIWFL